MLIATVKEKVARRQNTLARIQLLKIAQKLGVFWFIFETLVYCDVNTLCFVIRQFFLDCKVIMDQDGEHFFDNIRMTLKLCKMNSFCSKRIIE